MARHPDPRQTALFEALDAASPHLPAPAWWHHPAPPHLPAPAWWHHPGRTTSTGGRAGYPSEPRRSNPPS